MLLYNVYKEFAEVFGMEQAKVFQEDPILWKDRKRILGMPISFTRYSVDGSRLYCKVGFFTTTTDELMLYRILDIKLRRTLWQKLFGVGTITLYSADQSHREQELKNIKKPDSVRKFLSKLIEQERMEKGITGREMYGSAGMDLDGCEHTNMFFDANGDGIPD